MFRRHEPRVLVVGAGPVGLFTALSLKRRSVDVEIVDQERRPTSHSYALALHPSSLELLESAEIDLAGLRDCMRVEHVTFYDGPNVQATVNLAELPVRHPYLLVMRQSHLEQVLEHELLKRKVHVRWHHRLASFREEDDHVIAEVKKVDRITTGYPIATSEEEVVKEYRWRPRFLVGADGHRSLVRRELGIGFRETGPAQLFGVFEFETETPPPNEVRVVFHEGTTNVLWPLPDGRVRWSFELPEAPEDGDSRYKSRLAVQMGADAFPHLTGDLLNELLSKRAPWFGQASGEIYWSVMARFERRIADSFGRGRVWLAGDAGHLTGPVGMHSMNVGLREAADLSDRIGQVEAEAAGLEIFTSYDPERATEWRHLLGVDQDVIAVPGADEWVRQHARQIHGCLPGSRGELELLAGQLGLQLDPSPASV